MAVASHLSLQEALRSPGLGPGKLSPARRVRLLSGVGGPLTLLPIGPQAGPTPRDSSPRRRTIPAGATVRHRRQRPGDTQAGSADRARWWLDGPAGDRRRAKPRAGLAVGRVGSPAASDRRREPPARPPWSPSRSKPQKLAPPAPCPTDPRTGRPMIARPYALRVPRAASCQRTLPLANPGLPARMPPGTRDRRAPNAHPRSRDWTRLPRIGYAMHRARASPVLGDAKGWGYTQLCPARRRPPGARHRAPTLALGDGEGAGWNPASNGCASNEASR
jgi:hypothetical protein